MNLIFPKKCRISKHISSYTKYDENGQARVFFIIILKLQYIDTVVSPFWSIYQEIRGRDRDRQMGGGDMNLIFPKNAGLVSISAPAQNMMKMVRQECFLFSFWNCSIWSRSLRHLQVQFQP